MNTWITIEPNRWLLPLTDTFILDMLLVEGETFVFLREDGEVVGELDLDQPDELRLKDLLFEAA